jgi:hypothetical protein
MCLPVSSTIYEHNLEVQLSANNVDAAFHGRDGASGGKRRCTLQ